MSETDDERRQAALSTLSALLTGLSETLARSANNRTKITEISLRLNEDALSLAEKWILLDGATIALSLAFIGSLISRSGRVPRHPFEWLVCPAWLLLLLSMSCCWATMSAIHRVNFRAVQAMAADVERYGLQILSLSISLVRNAAKNAVVEPVDNQQLDKLLRDLLQVSATVTDEITKSGEESHAATEKGLATASSTGPFQRVAVITTAMALILLCAFAITAILSL